MADVTEDFIRKSGLSALSSTQEASEMADALVRGAVNTLKKPIDVPNYSGTDTSKLKTDVEKVRTSRDVVDTTVDDEKKNYGAAVGKAKSGIDSEAAAKIEAEKADQERAQTIANIHQVVGGMTGIGIDPNQEAATIVKHLADTRPELDARLDEIKKLQDADNPLDWLTNQFVLPGKINAYNAVATSYNAAQNTLDETIKTANDISAFAAKAVPTITAAQAAAKSKVILSEAEIKKAAADEKLATQNVTFAVQKLSADIAAANQTENMTKIQQQENELIYRSQINAINLADTHASRLLKAAELIEKLQDKAGMQKILENYDVIMGHPKGTTSLYIWKNFKEERRQEMVAIGSGSLGVSPLSATATFWANKPGPGVSEDTLRLMSWTAQRVDEFATLPKVQGMDEKQKKNEIDKMLINRMNTEIAGASEMGNLFYEMNPAKMIASGAIPAASEAAKALAPLANQSGNVPTEMVLQTILANESDPAKAGALIAGYYTKNIELRNSTMNTSTMGVKLPSSYIVKSGGPFSLFKGTFDLTKPADATKWVLFQKQAATMNKGVLGGLGDSRTEE